MKRKVKIPKRRKKIEKLCIICGDTYFGGTNAKYCKRHVSIWHLSNAFMFSTEQLRQLGDTLRAGVSSETKQPKK